MPEKRVTVGSGTLLSFHPHEEGWIEQQLGGHFDGDHLDRTAMVRVRGIDGRGEVEPIAIERGRRLIASANSANDRQDMLIMRVATDR